MATNTGKGKKKGNKKTIPLAVLLSEDNAAPQGFNVVNTRKLDWAESMDNDDLDDKFTLNYKRSGDTTKVLLPTAPKATRGPDIDMARVPLDPPFKAYLGNLPYDVTSGEISQYFSKLNIKDVRLPHVNGRQRGFAYAEFDDRQSLIDALTMNGDMFRNRQLKVGLPGDNTDNNSRESNREERQDRTAGDWRSAPREDDSSARDVNRDNYQSYSSRNGSNDNSDKNMQRRGNDSDSYGRNRFENDRTFRPSQPSSDRGFERSNYSNDRGYDRPNDRGFERSNDRGFERSNDRGFERSNDRGFERSNDRGFERSNDRGFERSNDRGFDRSNDRGFDRPNNRYGNRYNDRTDGFDEKRDYGNFNERRNESRREFGGGFESRRNDTQYESRNTASPTNEGDEEQPRERPKLQLKPRTIPREGMVDKAATNSAIFGGAKPVNTAARDQEIEQKLKEKEESDKRHLNSALGSNERIRRISAGSNVSGNSRSRKGSDSGPTGSDDNYRNNGSHRNSLSRQRKTSERSDRSAGTADGAPKYILTRNKDSSNSSQAPRIVSVRDPDTRPERGMNRGNGNSGPNRYNNNNINNNRRKDRERDSRDNRSEGLYRPPRMSAKSDGEEEPKVAYTTSNKFAHLSNEDYDEDDGHNASD